MMRPTQTDLFTILFQSFSILEDLSLSRAHVQPRLSYIKYISDTLVVGAISVTRLGNFLKFWVTNLLAKVVQIIGKILGYFEKHLFLSKNCCRYFWATFCKIGQL